MVYNYPVKGAINMDQIKIGKFIAWLRREANLTQEELGAELGVTNKTISRWENGNYMPDIEMLKLLSDRFHVSINELLSGEKLNDINFREKADFNLTEALGNSIFTVKERFKFWERKWIREHTALLILCVVAAVTVFLIAWLSSVNWLIGLCPIVWIIVYAALRNRMMIYIENKIYGNPGEEKNGSR